MEVKPEQPATPEPIPKCKTLREFCRRAFGLRNVILIVLFAIDLAALIYIAVTHKNVLMSLMHSFKTYVEGLWTSSPYVVTLFFFQILLLVQVAWLPLHSTVCVFYAFLMKNIIGATIVLSIFSTLNSVFIFIVCRKYFSSRTIQVVEKYRYSRVFLRGLQNYPWWFSLIARLMFVPTGLKDWVLSSLRCPWKVYLPCATFAHLVFGFEASVIGFGLAKGLEDPRKRSPNPLIWIFWILFVVVLCSLMGVWAKREVDREVANQLEEERTQPQKLEV